MTKKKVPVLLSFYGLSNGKRNLFFGKLAYSSLADLSFKNYSRWKTFRSILALYSARPIRERQFEMVFDHGMLTAKTDHSGSFWCEVDMDERQTQLVSITLSQPAEPVLLTEDLYPNRVHAVTSGTIVISDIDDTLIHSFVGNTLKQLRTLLFTTIEKRKTVVTMANMIKRFRNEGYEPFYLSNSEQNLYPMLYRFMTINEFPLGPLFLKQYVRLRHIFWRRFSRKKILHKQIMLEKIMELFPDKKYILLGDNTQQDLAIYRDAAEKYPQNIRYIVIREVKKKPGTEEQVQRVRQALSPHNITLHYSNHFPDDFSPGF